MKLPSTSPEHYLTGTSAMAIPSRGTSFLDWHFVDAFLGQRAEFRLAGVNFPDTTRYLGQRGVRECGQTLRELGVAMPDEARFYAADRDRAFLDLLVRHLMQGRRPDHLRVEDFCEDAHDAEELLAAVGDLRAKLAEPAQERLLNEWLESQ